jgi:hypothetical protein
VRALLVLLALTAPAAADAPDYVDDARLFYRIVACAGDDAVDQKIQKVVAKHCKWMGKKTATFRTKFIEPATAFFANARPAGLPTTVVYPFGGGDLISAMVTYPDATEITTLSLERGGDPRKLAKLSSKKLDAALKKFRLAVSGLLSHSVSETVKLRASQKDPIPSQLGMFVTGAALLGFRPVHLRYFHLDADGAVVYDDGGKKFDNLELQLEDDTGRIVTHRHFASDLSDDGLPGSAMLKHLEAKGTVSVVVKSASYLLWMKGFDTVRSYLATHLAWMASDSTGFQPKYAKKMNLEQETYGQFSGVALNVSEHLSDAMVTFWASQPRRKLKFRYGYRDNAAHGHLMITRPKP